MKGSKWLQMITLVGKVFVLLLIAFFGIYNLAIGKYTALENAFEGSSSNPGKNLTVIHEQKDVRD